MSKIPQFWLLYLDIISNQVMVHTDVQTNALGINDLLICSWKIFLPMYFAMNKVNYARLAVELFLPFLNIFYDFNN